MSVPENKTGDIGSLLQTASDDPRWEHERKLILDEIKEKDPAALLAQFAEITDKIAKDVEGSKAKDDKRGVRVIPDYAEAHEPAHENSFVKQTLAEAAEIKKQIDQLVKKLGA